MKDRFEIFSALIILEERSNHFGCYIAIGQMRNLIWQVNSIYDSWDDSKTFEENVYSGHSRCISPMGDAGKNRL